jgi:hypothetical protein
VPALAGAGVLVAVALLLLVSGPDPVTLVVRTAPDSAFVYLDQTLLGAAPVSYRTEAGTRRLRIEKEGYLPLDTIVTLTRDLGPQAFTLVRATSKAVITSEPSGAEVWLDGQRIGATPLLSLVLPAGTHQVVLRKYGYKEYRAPLPVTAGRLAQVAATLDASDPLVLSVRSAVEVTVTPAADIFIGGFLVAEDTTRFTERLPRGQHAIRVEHPALGAREQEVDVRDAETRTVAFDLNQPPDE